MIPEDLKALVARHQRFLISSHANPDGDAIGSELALLRLLRRAGKAAQIWNFHPTPGTYRALPDSASIHFGAEPPAGFPGAFDCAVVLECPTLDRTGLAEALSRLPLLNIDHHLGNSGYVSLPAPETYSVRGVKTSDPTPTTVAPTTSSTTAPPDGGGGGGSGAALWVNLGLLVVGAGAAFLAIRWWRGRSPT